MGKDRGCCATPCGRQDLGCPWRGLECVWAEEGVEGAGCPRDRPAGLSQAKQTPQIPEGGALGPPKPVWLLLTDLRNTEVALEG